MPLRGSAAVSNTAAPCVGRDVGAVPTKARTVQQFRGYEDGWVAPEGVLHGDGLVGTNNELVA